MERDKVIAILRQHEDELREVGVAHLSLFGSIARGDARDDSDVDLLAVFDPARRLSLIDVLRIERRIASLLGRPVDLIEEGMLKPRAQAGATGEALRAF